MTVDAAERRRRWRLVLGAASEPGESAGEESPTTLSGDDRRIDAALGALYDQRPGDAGRARSGGLGRSAPAVARWLGDIRRYFPSSIVQVVQRDAIERLNLRQLLFEPELLAAIEPDIHLAGLLVELHRLLPDETRATARTVVRGVVEQVVTRLAAQVRSSVAGALARAERAHRPRPNEIDWRRTIEANLKHYQADYRSVIPERLVGYSRRQRALSRDVIVAIDQSGSMIDSIVYAALFGSVLASIPSLRTSIVAFDTAVADLTDMADDPVDVLFGVHLGGGTDISAALGYCQQLIERPASTLLVLVSDLFEGGNEAMMLERSAALVRSGVSVMVLAALSDEGAPVFDRRLAASLAGLGIPTMSCTPDSFPELFAAALERRDLGQWSADRPGVVALR